MRIRKVMWQLGILREKECPYCGRKLTPHGFEGQNKRYTCKNKKCEFNDY